MVRILKLFRSALVLVLAAGSAAAAQTAIGPELMLEQVKYLSGKDLRGRGPGTPELDQAAAFIAARFEAVGLVPGGNPSGSWYQEWIDPETGFRMRNVVGVLPGRSPEMAGQSVVIGAHYDHLGTAGAAKEDQGKVHPGADDNASGVAVLLEMASRLPLVANMERSVVFVAFTGEEAGRKGSRYYVLNEKRYPLSKAVGMINLDTVGRLGKGKIIVLGSGSAKEWSAIITETAKRLKLAIAESAQDLDASDHTSFHEAGVPAVQFFTGPHLDYHRLTDTFDKIDGKGMAKVAMLTRAVAFALATSPGTLTRTITAAPGPAAAGPRTGRKVTIGAVPDFTFNGQGVRLGGTQPGGPVDQAGMKEGDIIIQAGGVPVIGLKDLSDVLKTKQPGDPLPVRYLRHGRELQTVIEVREK
ncbi:MAG: M20/M25/M40 family metallo-hydrolase [Nitrospirota bacterium]